MARKLWKVERGDLIWRPESQAKAYAIVRTEATNWVQTQIPIVRVYIDERDGQGWQLYEVINLKEQPLYCDQQLKD